MRQHRSTRHPWALPPAVLCLLVLALGAPSGCGTSTSFLDFTVPTPTADIHQVVASWNSELQSISGASAPARPIPALAGQVYLFGADASTPTLGDGDLIVELCREDQVGEDQAIIPLQEWRIDRAKLQHFKHKDAGWGYALVLPWGSYNPTVTRVQIRTRFEPPGGDAVQAESASLTLASANQQQGLVKRQPEEPVPQAMTPLAARQSVGPQ